MTILAMRFVSADKLESFLDRIEKAVALLPEDSFKKSMLMCLKKNYMEFSNSEFVVRSHRNPDYYLRVFQEIATEFPELAQEEE